MSVYGKTWKKKRAVILRRDKYKSQLSARYGRSVEADTVHHILPVEYFPEYKLIDWNLISLSSEEHNRMHDRTTHRLTAEGMALAIMTARKQGLDIEQIKVRLNGNDMEKR